VEDKTQYNNGEVGLFLTHMDNLLAQLINEEVGISLIHMDNLLALYLYEFFHPNLYHIPPKIQIIPPLLENDGRHHFTHAKKRNPIIAPL
jgi:hypothetical protein